jgi:hypothetical protein
VNRILQRAFTLIEVNLAIFIMAGGVLAMISLYSLGFRESRQSREDVAASAIADDVLNPLVVALSSRKLKWSEWRGLNFQNVSSGSASGLGGVELQVMPGSGGAGSGWLAYLEKKGSKEDAIYYVPQDPESKARGVYDDLIVTWPDGPDGYSKPQPPKMPTGMTYALVASRENENSPVITLAVRCVRKNLRNTLMSQPVFSTEVHFQGDPNN